MIKIIMLLSVLVSLNSANLVESRIVGGKQLNSIKGKEFVVSIMTKAFGQYNASCGGALIDELHVVTAAHCITDNDFYIFANHHISLMGQLELSGGQTYTPKGDIVAVSRVYKHNDFGKGLGSDLAVMELEKPIRISNYARLPTLSETEPLLQKNQELEVLGWGLTSDSAVAPSNTLRSVTIKALTPNQCKSDLFGGNIPEGAIQGDSSALGLDTSGIICAGGQAVNQASTGACQGDSGGPLVYHNQGKFVLLGVVSSGASAKCTDIKAGNYTRVDKNLDFIKKALDNSYVSEGILRNGYIKSLPLGFSLVGTEKAITSNSKIFSKDIKRVYVYDSLKRKWETYEISNGTPPANLNIPPKYGFWIYK